MKTLLVNGQEIVEPKNEFFQAPDMKGLRVTLGKGKDGWVLYVGLVGDGFQVFLLETFCLN